MKLPKGPVDQNETIIEDPATVGKASITEDFRAKFERQIPAEAAFMTYNKDSRPPEITFYDAKGVEIKDVSTAYSRALLLKITQDQHGAYTDFMRRIEGSQK